MYLANKLKKVFLLPFLTAAILFSIMLIQSHSSDWCFIDYTKDNYYFIDAESIEKEKQAITFWIIKMSIDTGNVEMKKRATINCENETVSVKEIFWYNESGNIVNSIKYTDSSNWTDIASDSTTQRVKQSLCKGGFPRDDIKEFLKKQSTK